MKPYSPPKTFKKQVELLKSIQGYIDQIQELHLDTGSNGYLFQLNECHSNSEHLFNILKYLQKQKLVSKKDKVEIVFGYISMLIPFGTLVGNVMVECEHVILHEWHVWNYMNGCLIDLSLFHQGLSIDINAQISSWGKAQDHVFIMPPPNVAYLGRAFSDIHKFNSKVKKHFPQDPQQ
ncbi:hypothetical protein [Desulfobotulus mexicanus]|uniref:Uncharacterized protein n=1 Tax=Desulfobotulus mexicanus TaxID=2586642 RepID=A0A5Q4VHM4_9BACT|nr:hypothetical protein [Desulfobotulus mexicanus]TYT75680.1 hypothetical protein FIM25_04375 [Desulfobotulus mexicanus]